MKQETAEDMLDFAKEVCQKYSRVKMLAEETQMQWRQDLEMAADSKYPGEKEMYDRQAEEGLARYTAVREWLKLADAAAFRIRDSKAQIVVRQHCLDRIPLKAVEFENGKHMGKTAVFYHKKSTGRLSARCRWCDRRKIDIRCGIYKSMTVLRWVSHMKNNLPQCFALKKDKAKHTDTGKYDPRDGCFFNTLCKLPERYTSTTKDHIDCYCCYYDCSKKA